MDETIQVRLLANKSSPIDGGVKVLKGVGLVPTPIGERHVVHTHAGAEYKQSFNIELQVAVKPVVEVVPVWHNRFGDTLLPKPPKRSTHQVTVKALGSLAALNALTRKVEHDWRTPIQPNHRGRYTVAMHITP